MSTLLSDFLALLPDNLYPYYFIKQQKKPYFLVNFLNFFLIESAVQAACKSEKRQNLFWKTISTFSAV